MTVLAVIREIAFGCRQDLHAGPYYFPTAVISCRIPLSYRATRKTNLHRNIRFLGAIKVEHRRFHPDSCPQKGFLSEAANERRQIRVSTQRLPIEGVAIRAGNRSEGTPLMNNHIFRRPTESSGENRTSQQRYGGCGKKRNSGHEKLLKYSRVR